MKACCARRRPAGRNVSGQFEVRLTGLYGRDYRVEASTNSVNWTAVSANLYAATTNAGYGVPGSLVSQPWERHRDFIQVLMTAPVELCYRYVPGMRARGVGHVVNIASLAGHTPGSAGHTLYGASKAFLIRFSQSLAFESHGAGVHVTAVCPGFTYSEFHDVTGTRAQVSAMPRWMWSDALDVAREGLAAVTAGRPVVVTGRVNRAIAFGVKHLPAFIADAAVHRSARNFRKL